MTNLLAETEAYLKDLHLKPEDVAWVGSANGTVASSWDRFAALTHDLEYDAGYGAQEIASDLVVVFKDGSWLERHEYDGSEGWVYKTKPLLKLDARPLTAVMHCGHNWGISEQNVLGLDNDEPEPGVTLTWTSFNHPFAAP